MRGMAPSRLRPQLPMTGRWTIPYRVLEPLARTGTVPWRTVMDVTVPIALVEQWIREAVPAVSTRDLHNLMYLCDGYYLDRHSETLFDNDMVATPEGAFVTNFIPHWVESDPPSGFEKNLVDEVLPRYAGLSGEGLGTIVRSTHPWVEANGGGWAIAVEVIRDDFLRTLPR